MGRRRKWLNKVKRVLGNGQRKQRFSEHGKAPETDDEAENALSLHGFNQEPDMLVERTVDDTVLDIPWSILEEPYVVDPVEQNVSMPDEAVRSDENERAEAVGVSAELTRFDVDLDEEAAAILIQKAIRKHLAKRRLRGLRGAARLKALIQGSSNKRQTTATLQCMQTLSRVQCQIRSRRIRMSEENQALQRQIQQKHEKEMEKMKLGDDWNDSTKSKEKLEASLRKRQEAAARRERALAYAHSFQQKWRKGDKAATRVYIDPIYPHWGWSWLDRWMAVRPWESTTATEDPVRPLSVDEISKAYYAHRDRHPDTKNPPLLIPQRPSRRIIPNRPTSKTPTSPSNATKLNSPRPKSVGGNTSEQDSKTTCSVQMSNQKRRHSIASLSMPACSISARTLASSEAHKARLQKSASSSGNSYGRVVTGSLISPGSVKKLTNLSAARRHSGPPKVDLSSIENVSLKS